MNKFFSIKKAIAVVLAIISVLAVPSIAFAAKLSVGSDSASVKTGDTVTVTIVVSDNRVAVAQGVFTYDPKVLKYVSSDGGASDGFISLVSAQSGGASSLSAVIKFMAASEGDAKINVSMESVLDYDGNALEKPEDAGVIVKVASSGNNTGKSDEPGKDNTTPAPDFSKTGVAAKNVKGTDAKMFIWRSLESLTLPSGFYDRQVEYGTESVGGAAIPDTDFILLYLSEKTGDNAGYYIYDKDKDFLYPFVSITSVQANFTVLWPDDSIKAPEGFEPAVLKWKERDMPAWTAKGSDGTVYLVYARNASGDTGFFLYNSTDKSVQRYETFSRTDNAVAGKTGNSTTEKPAGTKSAAEQKKDSDITVDSTVFFAICLVTLALLAGVTILLILNIHNNPHKKQKGSLTDNRK